MNIANIARFAIVAALCAAMPAPVFSREARSESRQTVSSPPGSSRLQAGLTEKVDYYDDGKVMARSRSTPEGRLVEKHHYYHDGKVKKIERYDAAGEKIEESNYDDNGNLDDNFDGWAAKRWLYKNGQLRVESTYGEDGHLTERKIYNDLGDLADRQYIGDGNIDPNEEFNRGSVATKETDQFYNKYGDQSGSVTTEVGYPDDMFGDDYLRD